MTPAAAVLFCGSILLYSLLVSVHDCTALAFHGKVRMEQGSRALKVARK